MPDTSMSRRSIVAGASAVAASVIVPAGIIDALAADTPPTSPAEALPPTFDPQAFCNDLIDAGFRITAHRPVRTFLDGDEDLRPSFYITPADGGGFGKDYTAVMARWSDAMDACPDHVEQVVRHLFDKIEAHS